MRLIENDDKIGIISLLSFLKALFNRSKIVSLVLFLFFFVDFLNLSLRQLKQLVRLVDLVVDYRVGNSRCFYQKLTYRKTHFWTVDHTLKDLMLQLGIGMYS